MEKQENEEANNKRRMQCKTNLEAYIPLNRVTQLELNLNVVTSP